MPRRASGESDEEEDQEPGSPFPVTSVNSNPSGTSDRMLWRKVEGEEEEVQVLRFCATPEQRRFIYINPVVFSQFSGIGLLAFLDQFLKLWPTIRHSALPYLSIPAVVSGAVGFGIGIHSLRNPGGELTNPFKRTWFAALEGFGIVFPFLLGEEIQIYCAKAGHLDAENRCMVSEATFWESFFPAPAALAVAYAGWKMIPLLSKITWMSHGKFKKGLVITLDGLADVLFFNRILQTFLANISQIPQPLTYEAVAIPAGVLALTVQTLKPQHREKVRMAVTGGMTINLMVYLVKFLMMEFSLTSESEKDPYSWSPLLKSIGFSFLFVAGCVATVWYSRQYVSERRKTETLIPVGDSRTLLAQQLAEALERPEVRQVLVKRMLEEPQMKAELLQDPVIKGLLMQDTGVRAMLRAELRAEWDEEAEEIPLGDAEKGTEMTDKDNTATPLLFQYQQEERLPLRSSLPSSDAQRSSGGISRQTPRPRPSSQKIGYCEIM